MAKSIENSKEIVLVCVTDQFSCDKLIRAGKEFADGQGKKLEVFSVQPKSHALACSEALEHLFNVAKQVDAEMTVFYSDEPVRITTDYIKSENISDVVVGNPSAAERGFVQTVIELSSIQVWIFHWGIFRKAKFRGQKPA